MNEAILTISLYQADDEDGLARFKVHAANEMFSLSTLVWGYAEQLQEIADAIKGFPVTASSAYEYQLGSDGVGLCRLSFCCIDNVGYAAVWITGESAFAVVPTSRFQTATICVQFEPASLDIFHSELVALASGLATQATLYGN